MTPHPSAISLSHLLQMETSLGIFDIRQILEQHPDVDVSSCLRSSLHPSSLPSEGQSRPALAPLSLRLLPQRSRRRRSTSDPMSAESDDDYGILSNWQRGSLNSTASSFSSSSSAVSSPIDTIAEAVVDHVAVLSDELPFASGDIIQVLDSSSPSGLWFGICRGCQGWFPASYVRVISPCGLPSAVRVSSSSSSSFTAPQRQQRVNAVVELVKTERDYVQLLDNLVHGFVSQSRRRPDLFPGRLVDSIFSNIEQLLALHCRLLRDLELSLDVSSPEKSVLGGAFLRHRMSFPIYAVYCNNRPVSCAELANLSKQPVYQHFFEACRLLRGLSRLSLEAFLLTPVQRICRYPLQLSQLLKVTPEDHADFVTLSAAIRAMKEVAAHLDERRRRIEAIQNILVFQKSLHSFRGPDLVEKNCVLVKNGEVMCRCVSALHHWSKQVVLFLFDQTLLLCKREVFPRVALIFKERISLSSVALADVPDGKDPIFHVSVKNSFRLHGEHRQFLFSCSDEATKKEWLVALTDRSRLPPPATAEEKRIAIATLKLTDERRVQEIFP